MKVLVACEESQRVCEAFRSQGHEAYSCDIQHSSGGHPEWHIHGDVLAVLNGACVFDTEDGQSVAIETRWDLIIAHPPCTHLAVSGARWFANGKKPIRLQDEAADFFMKFVMADCNKVAIENPIGVRV